MLTEVELQIALATEYTQLLSTTEELRSERNRLAKVIAAVRSDAAQFQAKTEEMKALKQQILELEVCCVLCHFASASSPPPFQILPLRCSHLVAHEPVLLLLRLSFS